jgi:hypothetical protein
MPTFDLLGYNSNSASPTKPSSSDTASVSGILSVTGNITAPNGSDVTLDAPTGSVIALLNNGTSTVTIDDAALNVRSNKSLILEPQAALATQMIVKGGNGTSPSVETGMLLSVDNNGSLEPANANGTKHTEVVVAVALEDGNSAATDDSRLVCTVVGQVQLVSLRTTPASSNIGDILFLSKSSGSADLTAPSSTGDHVVRIGILMDDTAINGLYQVLFQPQFIEVVP